MRFTKDGLFSASAYAVAFGMTALQARAQCTMQPVAGPGVPGVIRTTNPMDPHGVNALAWWDQDGSGPLPARLVVGGAFEIAGTASSHCVALWDPTNDTWAPLAGLAWNQEVKAIAAGPNGDLFIGGSFGVRERVGTNWVAVGGTSPGQVRAMLLEPNGDIVVAGELPLLGNVARWDGSTWSTIGGGLPSVLNGHRGLRSITSLPNGDLVACGSVLPVGFVTMTNEQVVARWNGSAWTQLGPSFAETVRTVAVNASGDLLLGGNFTNSAVQRWDGSNWQPIGDLPSAALVLANLPNGDLIAGGWFSSSSHGQRISRWNGISWQPLGDGLRRNVFGSARVSAIAIDANGNVFAGGDFDQAGSAGVANLARWDNSDWSAIGSGINGRIDAVGTAANGDLLVAGPFSTIGNGVAVQGLALHDGTNWHDIGGGINGVASAISSGPFGEIIVTGTFTEAGGTPVQNIASWDGVAWQDLGPVNDRSIWGMHSDGDGRLIVHGGLSSIAGIGCGRIATWDGTSWNNLNGGVSGSVFDNVAAVDIMSNGDIIAGGDFSNIGGVAAIDIARWNGTNWSALPGLPNTNVRGVAVLPDQTIVAATGSSLYHWQGAGWSLIATADATLYGVSALPNGDLVVCGTFSTIAGIPAAGLARRSGGAWQQLGGGLDWWAFMMSKARGGRLAVAGWFTASGPDPAASLLRIETSCPPAISSFGLGCSAVGPAANLQSTGAPMTGETFEATANGFPHQSLVLSVLGFAATSLPLTQLLPSLPGCDLLVQPDALTILSAAGGTGQAAIAIPADPTLVGGTFYLQAVGLEYFGALQIAQATASNALALTVGSW